ncbi:MAG TPA: hypothetical protein PK537_04650, partial [Candidatus Limiplasma sp.]|nr:hypothetical protein [Candidatus Limiplasma sp.]
ALCAENQIPIRPPTVPRPKSPAPKGKCCGPAVCDGTPDFIADCVCGIRSSSSATSRMPQAEAGKNMAASVHGLPAAFACMYLI